MRAEAGEPAWLRLCSPPGDRCFHHLSRASRNPGALTVRKRFLADRGRLARGDLSSRLDRCALAAGAPASTLYVFLSARLLEVLSQGVERAPPGELRGSRVVVLVVLVAERVFGLAAVELALGVAFFRPFLQRVHLLRREEGVLAGEVSLRNGIAVRHRASRRSHA